MDNQAVERTGKILRLAPRQAGMTLVEIMIVLTIMAGIMGFAAYSVVGYLKSSKIKDAQAEVAQIKGFIQNYYIQCNSYPDDLSDLESGCLGAITDHVPNDPWDNPYEYVREQNSPVVFSAGPDGQSGTEDDVYAEGDGGN
ncbi:MAG: type II secretion system protein GspG [Myxococcales bacterium]|nr:type II secretion system protein GspG [Myxococcales bacterium]